MLDFSIHLLNLIAKRVPFKKLVALPRGSQYGIIGPVVNVPSNIADVNNVLPRVPTNCHIIPLKFKRKLIYKGHYMHQFIRPQKVMSALQWLAENNMHYNSTTIANSETWKNAWNNDNEHFSSLIEGYQAKEHPVEDNIKSGVISDTIQNNEHQETHKHSLNRCTTNLTDVNNLTMC